MSQGNGHDLQQQRNTVPQAPPLPAPRPFQGVRNAAYKIIGLQSRPPSPQHTRSEYKLPATLSSLNRFAELGATQDATTSHRTGLEINTLAINEKGTHALLGGKEIFKTVKIENGVCVEDRNLRTAIRSTPTQASGELRKVYSIDIADVAWAKGDCGDYVAAATTSGKIILYDLGHAGLQAALLHEHARQVHKVTFNPHRGNLLLSGSQDGTVRLWDVKDPRSYAGTLQSKRKFSGAGDGVRDVKWSPTDGVDFAFSTDSGWIQRWDIRNLKVAKIRIPAHQSTCTSIDWHPDGKHVVSAGMDKMLRIWDFSTSRRHKPVCEVRTPYSISNARWRPACESSMPEDQGARMCTQIATAYDQGHPVIHIWDLRRPALPFRELCPSSSAATDLLWHSQDLLWTVGQEGIFMQTDIHHTNKVIERRNLQAIAVSSRARLSFAAQKRHVHRTPRHTSLPMLQAPRSASMSQSPEFNFLSRSWADESLDHSFLTMQPKRVNQSKSSTRYSSATATPPSGLTTKHVLKLDDVLLNRQSFTPRQSTFTGPSPLHSSSYAFTLLAQANALALHRFDEAQSFLQHVYSVFDQCNAVARAVGQPRLAQTWNIVAFSIDRHLSKRFTALAALSDDERTKLKTGSETIRKAITSVLEKTKSPSTSPGISPASMGPISSIAQALAGTETNSNMTTPLARPVLNGRQISTLNIQTQLPDPEKDRDIDPLPPSLTSPQATTYDHSFAKNAEHLPTKLTHENLRAMQSQRTTPMPIEHDSPHQWSSKVKPLLDLESEPAKLIRPALLKHDSDESFSFLVGSSSSHDHSASTSFEDSVQPASMVRERPSRPLLRVNSESPVLAQDDLSSSAHNSLMAVMSLHDPLTDSQQDLESESVEQTVSQSVMFPKPGQTSPEINLLQQSSQLDCEQGEPYKILEMLSELVQYYATNSNAQLAAQLLLTLLPMLPADPTPSIEATKAILAIYMEAISASGTHDGLAAFLEETFGQMIRTGINPLQVESILSTYHEQLLAQRLFVEAASLRRICHRAFPAVYEYGLGADNLTLTCRSCRKRVESAHGQLVCGSCAAAQAGCAICSCVHSPFTKDMGGSLITACLLCNHNTHANCADEWFGQLRGRGCPTEGCLCTCVA